MTIVVTGGGSGGHITPILAVAAEIKKLDSTVKVVYIGQRGDALADIPASDPHIDEVYTVLAGKFRRYHGYGWKQLLDIKTQFLNARDFVYVLVGMCQSALLMRKLRPEVIFTRGGFVSVPVAIGGKITGVQYITHDSDSIPSLANRIIAKWATMHAVALPAEAYPYPAHKIRVTGVPVSHNYEPLTPQLIKHYRKLLHLDGYKEVLLVTGGGNGARALNLHVAANASYLLSRHPDLAILHITGRALVDQTREAYKTVLKPAQMKQVVIEGFVTDMYRYSGAADLIIARGGATNLAEFAIQSKACLIVPSPQLVWNVKNTKVMAKHDAIVELTEDQAAQEQRLGRLVSQLLADSKHRQALGRNLHKLAHEGSAKELADLLLDIAKQQDGSRQ